MYCLLHDGFKDDRHLLHTEWAVLAEIPNHRRDSNKIEMKFDAWRDYLSITASFSIPEIGLRSRKLLLRAAS